MIVPDMEAEQEFVIRQPDAPESPDISENLDSPETPDAEEFDLSDITATPRDLSREEIIAAAEAAAFEEQ